MRLVDCTFEKHAPEILAIFNEAILHSTALYDYQPRTLDSMTRWFAAKTAGQYPVIGLEDDETGALLGFASYGTFRAWPAYKYTVEHSIYIRADRRQSGLGRTLLTELIARATAQEYHVLIAGIDVTNTASIALHQRLGFVECGTLRQVGFKFGHWLDLAFYQRTLPTPTTPNDG